MGAVVDYKRMPVGDYIWDSPHGIVIVERKAVNDLLNSIKTGRASDQFRNLIEAASVPILLIEGKIGEHWNGSVNIGQWKGSKGWQSQWDFSAVDTILLAWQMAGLFLAHSPTSSKTAHRIVSLYRWTQKEEHLNLARRKVLSIKEDDPIVTTLSTFPGIGQKRAREILKKNSLEDICKMNKEELIKLVGKVTAQKVHGHFTKHLL